MFQHRLTASLRRFGLAAAALTVAGVAACATQDVHAASGRPAGCPDDGVPQTGLPRDQLAIQTARGVVRVNAQVADDDDERNKGLMFVRGMTDAEGMIFDFQDPQPLAFWMHNTFIPLDLLFIDAQGRILNIKTQAQPCDERPIRSKGDAVAVLELAGGAAQRLGVKPGDRVTGQRILKAR